MAFGSSKLPVSSTTLQNRFDRRSVILGGFGAGVGMLLAARMGYIGIAENEKYATESESNRVNLTLIPPRRGWILDRNGAPLASNRADFRVDIIPERLANPDREVDQLAEILQLDPVRVAELKEEIAKSRGFEPIEVGNNLSYEEFSSVSLRMPELPGVLPQRGFTRYYPTGPSVGHLIGYVGAASAEEYEKDRNPLLVTPGYKVGKDGLEKDFELTLRGVAGARRVEVTASGRVVRDLSTREDIQGKAVKLTIDGPLQDYAARRIGLESGAAVVIDCDTGGILAIASMPSFDPNSFVGGIGQKRWQMLNEDDHIPLLNKSVRGLYPPGSTVKPMATLALQAHGISPEERISCPGGYRLGSRFFRCDAVHGSVDMRTAIEKSCNTYFWAMAHRLGYDAIAPTAKLFGLGHEFDLPGTSQRYGTVPGSEWKMRRFKQEWSASDSLNAIIGQGYVLTSPLQLAVMVSRIASGKSLLPSLLFGNHRPAGPALPFTEEQFTVTREGMFRVVNGSGTAGVARIDINGVKLAGKTGTAQVRALVARGHVGDWKSRDHSLFVCYAPADKPKYAMAVVIEHGTFGSRAAAPIARDVMTYLFDPKAGLDILHRYEAEWGGLPEQRMARKYAAFIGEPANVETLLPRDAGELASRVDAESRLARMAQAQATPAEEPGARPSPSPSPSAPAVAPSAPGAPR